MVPLTPRASPWFLSYVENASPLDAKFLHKFRKRFRASYSAYTKLLSIVKSEDAEEYFSRWSVYTPFKRQSPIELLLLGSLRYLGRGWTFDDLEESTGISEEVHRAFFHAFVAFGSKLLYREYVILPSTGEDASSDVHEKAGMAGCVGSMDATHVLCERIPYDIAQEHKAFKLQGTARTYNVVVNHNRRILSTTRGHPARWNDKKLVRYDELATSLKEGTSPLDNHRIGLKTENPIKSWSANPI